MIKVHYSDQEYLLGLQTNNQKILHSLYKNHFPMILKMILNNSGTESEAKDVFQESIIVLYRNANSENFQLRCSVQTYLYAIAKRLWLKQLHKGAGISKWNNEMDEENDGIHLFQSDIELHQEKENQFRQLGESLAQLGEPCRTLIEDFYIRKMDMEELAEKFGYTNSDNAKTQKYKCLQRLKKLFFLSKED